MEEILRLIKGEVCMGTYGLVELELRKLVDGQKPSHNSDYAADLASKLSHIVRDRTGCDADLRRTLYEDFCKVLNASTHFA